MKLILTFLILAPLLATGQNYTVGLIPEGEIGYTCPPCGCPHDDGHFDAMGSCLSCGMALGISYPGVESQIPRYKQLTAGMLLFDNADIMDVTGPWSVLVHNGVRVISFAKTKDPVSIGGSMELKPDFTLDNLPDVDILIFPGGGLSESNPGDEAIQKFIKEKADDTEVLVSVCSGAFFLAESGLLDGQVATTFSSLIPRLEQNYPEIKVVNNVKYTDNGKIVTTAGLSSGIDGAFHVISKFRGQGGVQDVANHMEYEWSKSTDYARTQLADNYVTGIKAIVRLFSKAYISSEGDRNQWQYKYLLSGQATSNEVLNVINKELIKTKKWEIEQNSSNRLVGIFNHEVLGKGRISLSIDKNDDGEVLTVEASRLVKYQIVSNH